MEETAEPEGTWFFFFFLEMDIVLTSPISPYGYFGSRV